MKPDQEQNQLIAKVSEARNQFKFFAFSCLAIWLLIQFIEIAAGGRVSGTNAFSYCSVNAAEVFLPWPAVLLGCTSSKWPVRIPAGCIALFLAFALLIENTWGNPFNYNAEMSQYEQLSKKMLDQSTTIANYRYNPGAFSSFKTITRRETLVGPGLIFIKVISNTPE